MISRLPSPLSVKCPEGPEGRKVGEGGPFCPLPPVPTASSPSLAGPALPGAAWGTLVCLSLSLAALTPVAACLREERSAGKEDHLPLGQDGLRAGDIGVVAEELWALSAVHGRSGLSPDAPDPAAPCLSPLPFETELEGFVAVLVL